MERRAYKKPRSKKRKIKKPVRRFLDTLALCCGRCCQPRITDLDDEDQRHTKDKVSPTRTLPDLLSTQEEEPRLVLQMEPEMDHSIFSVGTIDIINSSQLHLDDESTDTDTMSQSDAGKQMKNKDIEEELVGDYFKMKCCKIEPDVYEVHLVNVATFVDFFGKVSNGMSIVLPERVSIGDDNRSEEVSINTEKGILDVSTKFIEETNTVIVTEEEDSQSLDVEYCNVDNIDKNKPCKEGCLRSKLQLLPKNVALFVNYTDNVCIDESSSVENNKSLPSFASNSEPLPKNIALFVDFIGKTSFRLDLEKNSMDAVVYELKEVSNKDEYTSDADTDLVDKVDEDSIDSLQEESFASKQELTPKNAAVPVDFCGTSIIIDNEEDNGIAEEPEHGEEPELLSRVSLLSLHVYEQQGLRDWSWCRYIFMHLVGRHFPKKTSTSNAFLKIQQKPSFSWYPSLRPPLMFMSSAINRLLKNTFDSEVD